jgi:hypothetical protein
MGPKMHLGIRNLRLMCARAQPREPEFALTLFKVERTICNGFHVIYVIEVEDRFDNSVFECYNNVACTSLTSFTIVQDSSEDEADSESSRVSKMINDCQYP